MELQISEEDFNNWWHSPVGKEIRLMLLERKKKIDDAWQNFLNSTVDLAIMAGRKLEIDDLLEMSYKDLMGE